MQYLFARPASAFAVLWTVGMAVAFFLPTPSFPQPDTLFSADKLVHAALFAGFGALWMHATRPPASAGLAAVWRRGAALFLLGALFAGATEAVQHALPHRSGDALDAAFDLAGLGAAIVAYGLALALTSRTASPAPPTGNS